MFRKIGHLVAACGLGAACASAHGQQLVYRAYNPNTNNIVSLPIDFCLTGVANDGHALTGYQLPAGGAEKAIIWSGSGATTVLNNIPEGVSKTIGITADGRVIYGYSDTPQGRRAWKVVGNGTFASLATTPADLLPGLEGDDGTAMPLASSVDGGVIVGYAMGGSGVEPCRWVSGSAAQSLTVRSPGWSPGLELVVSGDGEVIAWTRSLNGVTVGSISLADGTETVIYPSSFPAGTTEVHITSLSDNGSVAAGYFRIGTQTRAFKYSASAGVTLLPDMPGGLGDYRALAVGGDGSIVVGQALDGDENEIAAVMWNANNAITVLENAVRSAGYVTRQISLNKAVSVSSGGTAIAGRGISCTFEFPWDITIPRPPSVIRPPKPTTRPPTTAATLTVVPGGSGPFSYNWLKDGVSVSTLPDAQSGRVSGFNTATLTIDSVQPSDQAVYSVVITTALGTVTSTGAQLSIGLSRCNLADVASLGGAEQPDGQLTSDDIIAFLGAFFAGNLAVADVASLGGGVGGDGALGADDLILFLARFFTDCE